MTKTQAIRVEIPPKRYLSRQEAAMWLGLSVDTFDTLGIPYVDFGPRCKRWDIVDIETYAVDNKSHNSARASASQKGRQICVSTNATAHQNGGPDGQTRTVATTAKALGLKIKN